MCRSLVQSLTWPEFEQMDPLAESPEDVRRSRSAPQNCDEAHHKSNGNTTAFGRRRSGSDAQGRHGLGEGGVLPGLTFAQVTDVPFPLEDHRVDNQHHLGDAHRLSAARPTPRFSSGPCGHAGVLFHVFATTLARLHTWCTHKPSSRLHCHVYIVPNGIEVAADGAAMLAPTWTTR